MANIVLIGAGLGGLPTAYELRQILPREHQITLISPGAKFTFIPSLPWVALGLVPLSRLQVDLGSVLSRRGIQWLSGSVTRLDPKQQQVWVGEQTITYDYLVIATGADLDLESVPGLGPEHGYTQSVCTPHHAELAWQAWQRFLEQPGELVVGAVPGASCFGPLYEFALLADFVLRQKGLRVPITIVTPEPYAGHLGIGGMANSAQLVTRLLWERQINLIDNVAITAITPQTVVLASGESLPFKFAMVLPPFRGPQFVRQTPDLGDHQGFIPVLNTYQHPQYANIYSVGVVTQLAPPEPTPIPIGVPKTGQMTEAMGLAVAHNLAYTLGEIQAPPVQPTLEAVCFADFGNTGILFVAAPVIVPAGERHRTLALRGPWVGLLKTGFERYFLWKMSLGLGVPWFERWALRGLGLTLTRPLPQREPIGPGQLSEDKRGRYLSRVLWLVVLFWLVGWGLGMFVQTPAGATIRPLEESAGQFIYQTRQTLTDRQGQPWQAIAFRRTGQVHLRLVGFPGTVNIDHSRPLEISDAQGKILQAADLSSITFTDSYHPQANVGEYELGSVASELATQAPLSLTVPTKTGIPVHIPVPSAFVVEWQLLKGLPD